MLLVVGLIAAGSAWAEDQGQEPATVVRSREGLHWKLPPDWPIEKRDGVLGPIPIEEYLSRKFGALEKRLQTLEQQVSGMDLRLRVLEEQSKKQQQQMKSLEAVQ